MFIYSLVTDNSIGVEVNGLDQNLTGTNSTISTVFAALNIIENNTEGILAGNNSVVELLGNMIGFNGYGVEYRNSVAVVDGNIISQNNGSAGAIFPGLSPEKGGAS